MLRRDQILETYRTVQPHLRRTPVVETDGADFGLPSVALTFKLELLQHTGSFKPRGAFANLLLRDVPPAGVVAASGGNHGAAVAYAAHRLEKPARIFVPVVSSPAKIERIRSYGAELVITGDRYGDALEASKRFAAESGALEVHAYDQMETLLGAAGVGVEFEEQAPALDTLLIAVGGGGLIGGVAGWYQGRVRILGVEPEAAPTLACAFEAGHPVDAPAGGIAADSLAPRQVGQLMFPIARQFVERVVLVTDEAIQSTQEILWRVLHIAAEPGGAAAMAALVSGRYQPRPGERVGVLICGGNTTAVQFGH